MKPIELREADFRREIDKYTYPDVIKKEFFEYWTEPDRSPHPKMRYEKEKTWDIGRRLSRWQRSSKTEIAKTVHIEKKAAPVPTNDFDRLDAFINEMRKPGVTIPFNQFGNWYEFMKANRFLKAMTKADCDRLLEVYKGDKIKCRCAVVQQTLSGYISNELTIKDILKIRNQ